MVYKLVGCADSIAADFCMLRNSRNGDTYYSNAAAYVRLRLSRSG